ncbi:Response regulator receiver domain-containing protein [Verrucomicrobium sp. GAS474]|uniref:response regulator n=1 Tax=Verrucomicrobium sp. GAS474 TaxID=1882831 RepID=UPI00087DB080|nr:response regulator [Verrucomicrobium sp. GAS474]SDU15193.1 Response regulator receiver domain-containing protein [Verrucomicrobium sp. GAS474]
MNHSSSPASEIDPKPARPILVVEDNPGVGQLLVRHLTKAGFTPYLAPDGQTAIGWLATLKPVLVLLDITLPDLDGSEVFSRIRANRSTERTPVIFITGLVGPDEEEALNRNTDENKCYMGKPFTRDKLLSCISRMLGEELPAV